MSEKITTDQTTRADGTFNSAERQSEDTPERENRVPEPSFEDQDRVNEWMDTIELDPNHQDVTDNDDQAAMNIQAPDINDLVFVHREDMNFILAELEGSLRVSEEFREDESQWKRMEELGWDEDFEADMVRIRYILDAYGESDE